MNAKRSPVSQIAAAISGRGRYGHSPLYWWMWDHFDQLQKERHGRADWKSATEEFVKLGFTNRDKTELKRENVRKTWERVVRDRDKLPAKPPPAPKPPPSQPMVAREASQTSPKPSSNTASADPASSDDIRARLARSGLPMPKPLIR
jgi:hypothetical protein